MPNEPTDPTTAAPAVLDDVGLEVAVPVTELVAVLVPVPVVAVVGVVADEVLMVLLLILVVVEDDVVEQISPALMARQKLSAAGRTVSVDWSS